MDKKEFSQKLDNLIQQVAQAVNRFPGARMALAERTDIRATIQVQMNFFAPVQTFHVWLDKKGNPLYGTAKEQEGL